MFWCSSYQLFSSSTFFSFSWILKTIVAVLVVMWETWRDRKVVSFCPGYELASSPLHLQSKVFQGIVGNSFGCVYREPGRYFSRKSFQNDCGETVANLFVLHMVHVAILRFSSVSPHECQSRHFPKAWLLNSSFDVGVGRGCQSENNPDLRLYWFEGVLKYLQRCCKLLSWRSLAGGSGLIL